MNETNMAHQFTSNVFDSIFLSGKFAMKTDLFVDFHIYRCHVNVSSVY